MIIINPLFSLACITAKSKSFLLLITAFKEIYSTFNSLTIALAILVLPIPGLPYNIIEKTCLFLTKLDKILFSPIKCCCPTTSSNFFGLKIKANGSIKPPHIYFIKK